MKSARALAVFTVTLRGLALRVRVLPSAKDVDLECRTYEKRSRRSGPITRAFFAPARKLCGCAGTLVLSVDGRLAELVPHEVTHAVLHRIGGVAHAAEERLATDIGHLTARIFRQLARRGIEVRP